VIEESVTALTRELGDELGRLPIFDDARRREVLAQFACRARALGQPDSLVRTIVASMYNEPAMLSDLRRRALIDIDEILSGLGDQ
jgi:hypothetical protein